MEEKMTEEILAEELLKEADAASAEIEIEKEKKAGFGGEPETAEKEPQEETEAAEEESEEKAETAGSGAEPEAKKSIFGKKKKDPRDEKIQELTDRLQRSMAEFDNFRKRTEKEKSAMFEIGAKDIVERILPVADSLERGLEAIPEEERSAPFAEGMDKIYKQFMKILDEAGVKPIEALGKPFDPNFHNAVMHVEDESLGENIISQELQKGYTYRDTVVRHSMVQVAN